MYDQGETGNQNNIAQLFEEQVARHADAVAVVWGDSPLTYGELNDRANRLARLLCDRGVGLESPVGVPKRFVWKKSPPSSGSGRARTLPIPRAPNWSG